jgi:hypothetical protein
MDDKLNYLSVQRREEWALAEFTRVGEAMVQAELAEEIAVNPEAEPALRSDASMRARREEMSYRLMRKLNAEHSDRLDQEGRERVARQSAWDKSPKRLKAMAEGSKRDKERMDKLATGDHITDPEKRRICGLPPLEKAK